MIWKQMLLAIALLATIVSFSVGEVGTVMAQNATGNLTGGNMTSVGNTTNITVGGSGNMTTAPPGGGD